MTNEKMHSNFISFHFLIIFRVAAVERLIKVIVHQPACVKLRGVLSGEERARIRARPNSSGTESVRVSSGFHRLCHG